MDNKRVKAFTMFFLILLNIMLLGLNINKEMSSRLGAEQKQAITKLLADNGIELKADIPESHRAMGRVKFEDSGFDTMSLQQSFFEESEQVKRTEEFYKTILEADNGETRLEIQGNTFSFTGNCKKEVLSEADATEIARQFNEKIGKSVSRLDMELSSENENGWEFLCVQNFVGYHIFSNRAVISIGKDGSVKIDLSFLRPREVLAQEQAVISADEALFVAMSEILESEEESKSITGVALGYYAAAQDGLNADACYEITLTGGRRLYVNAYSGAIA